MTKRLLSETQDGFETKDIYLFDTPNKMKAILNDIRWKILKKLSREPRFPADLAREMGIHEQKIYYHIHHLIKAGLVKVAFEEEIRGAKARFYTTTEKAFGIELNHTEKGLFFNAKIPANMKLLDFFKEFFSGKSFDGFIVVGDPDPHGPHKTRARDGHYAIYLALFLGQILPPTNKLQVKLDVEARAEKLLEQNLILIGGPAVNLVTQDINSKMKKPVFDNNIEGIAPEANFGRGITSKNTNTFYAQNNIGIIFKEQNPFNPSKTIIGFAGQGRRGTKAAILALTNNWEVILTDYISGPFRTVVEGYDKDGDGDIDSIEILE